MAFIPTNGPSPVRNGGPQMSVNLAGGGGGPKKHRHDDEEEGKLFVGGLSWDTTQESLLTYFGRFGEVIDCVVMKNTETGRSRGFGFVTFKDPNNIDAVIASCPHTLDGRTIDPKACNPRSMQKPKKTAVQNYPKVFLGGLPSSITETDLRSFFSRYGEVLEVVIMFDQEKGKSRGFGFLSFADEAGCARAVSEHFVNIQNKRVEIKRAEPRTLQQQNSNEGRDIGQEQQWASQQPMTVNGHQQPPSIQPPPHVVQQPPQTAFVGWGIGAPPAAAAAPPPTTYPPQYTGHAPPAPATPSGPPQWGPPPSHQPPSAVANTVAPPPHWGHPPGTPISNYASPPPGSQVAPQQQIQYPGAPTTAVYPPPSTPQPHQTYWGGPPGSHTFQHHQSPPAGAPPTDIYGHPQQQGPPQQQPQQQKIEYGHFPSHIQQHHPGGSVPPPVTVTVASYPPYSQYQQPQVTAPAVHIKPLTSYAPATYEYQTIASPLSYPGQLQQQQQQQQQQQAMPPQTDVSGSLGPQRGAVYATAPSPYHPYRRT